VLFDHVVGAPGGSSILFIRNLRASYLHLGVGDDHRIAVENHLLLAELAWRPQSQMAAGAEERTTAAGSAHSTINRWP
jgi:hypothetical protein